MQVAPAGVLKISPIQDIRTVLAQCCITSELSVTSYQAEMSGVVSHVNITLLCKSF